MSINPLPRLRFVLERHPRKELPPGQNTPQPKPEGPYCKLPVQPPDIKSAAKAPDGRTPSLIPLLVAMDSVCMRGIEWSSAGRAGSMKVSKFKSGSRSRKSRERGIDSPRDALVAKLAKAWRLSESTIDDYLKDVDRFYYPRAVGLIEALLKLDYSPPLTLQEIAGAIAEHRPKNRTMPQPPLAPEGKRVNLQPVLHRPQQPSAQHAFPKARRP
jgi:hypothetical protein